jgi:hypothetical protein
LSVDRLLLIRWASVPAVRQKLHLGHPSQQVNRIAAGGHVVM